MSSEDENCQSTCMKYLAVTTAGPARPTDGSKIDAITDKTCLLVVFKKFGRMF